MTKFDAALRDWVKWAAWLIGLAFAVFFFMDSRHAHPPDVVEAEANLNRRIYMAESARYAEVAKFYTDKMRDGEELTPAEQKRLDLVQSQQARIHKALKE